MNARGLFTASRQAGFTLIEVLAALALSSVLLMSLNLGMTTIRQGVERARTSLGSQAALSAASGIFVSDAERIAKIRRAGGKAATYLFEGTARQMIYPVAEYAGAGKGGLYMVRLTASETDGTTQLIRDRAPISPGLEPEVSDDWADAVVLLEGPYDIEFAYRAQRSGIRSWSESWSAAGGMPEQLRLTITDRATGRLRMPVLVQSLQIDTEVDCVVEGSGCGGPKPEGAPQ